MAKKSKEVKKNEQTTVVVKVKPANFGVNSPIQANDRTRHSLSHYTNGD